MINMVAWVSGYDSRNQASDITVIARFARWGASHGPVWGFAAAIMALPLSTVFGYDLRPLPALGGGLLIGLLGGPVLGIVVGAVCTAADHAPEWLLDAPDYVAILAIIGVSAAVAWPLLDLGKATPVVAIVGLLLLAAAPLADAAYTAPRLLRPETQRS
jgi:hypothetical protein